MGGVAGAALFAGLASTTSGVIGGSITTLAGAAGAFFTASASTAVVGAIGQAFADDPQETPLSKIKDTIRKSDAPREYCYGKVRKGGVLLFAESTDSDSTMHMLFALADHQCEDIEKVYFDDELVVDLSGEAEDTEVNATESPYVDKAFFYKHLGSDSQTSDTKLTSEVFNWTTDHRLRGICYLYVRLDFDREAFSQGIPSVSAVIKGKNDIEDPRGPSTGYTNNPALCIADYMKDSRIGLNVGSTLPDSEINAAANECDETVNVKVTESGTASATNGSATILGTDTKFLSSGVAPGDKIVFTSIGEEAEIDSIQSETELTLTSNWSFSNQSDEDYYIYFEGARYALDGVVSSATEPQRILERMLTAMSGWITYVGGEWRMKAGSYTVPSVTLTEDDLRGSLEVSTRLSRRESFNAVRGTYVAPNNDWEVSDFPPITNSTYESEDGGERIWHDMELAFTKNPSRAQRLAKIELEKARQQISVNAVFSPAALQLAAGDTVNLTIDRFGWSTKPFEIKDLTPVAGENGTLGAALSLRETASTVYDFNIESDDTAPDPAPDTNLPTPSFVDPPSNLTQSLTKEINADGEVVQNIDLSWDVSPNGQLRDYEVQWKLDTESEYRSTNVGGSNSYTIPKVLPDSTYDVRVRAINNHDARSAFVATTVDTDTVIPQPAPISGLELFGKGNSTEFTGKDIKVGWRDTSINDWFAIGSEPEDQGSGAGALDKYFHYYLVNIYNGTTLLRSERTYENVYIYTFEKNAEDFEKQNKGQTGSYRTVTIEVQVKGRQNQLSDPRSITVSNPVPNLPTNLQVEAGYKQNRIKFDRPNDLDFAGVQIYRGTLSGFTRDSTSLIYQGPDNDIIDQGLSPDTTYYYRIRPYDEFGKSGLNESSEFVVTTTVVQKQDLDSTPPTDPSNLVLSGATSTAPLDLFSDIRAEWDASNDPNGLLAHYEVQIKPSSEAWGSSAVVSSTTADTGWSFNRATPGVLYDFRVRAVDWASNKSNWVSDSFTALGDTNAPSKPTNISVTAALRKLIIRWDNPTDDNWFKTRVYVGTTSGFTADASTLVFDGTSDTYIYDDESASIGQDFYIKLTSVSKSGVESGTTTESGPHNLSDIGSGNIDTFFQNAAIGSAYINDLVASKITTGTLTAQEYIAVNGSQSTYEVGIGKRTIGGSDALLWAFDTGTGNNIFRVDETTGDLQVGPSGGQNITWDQSSGTLKVGSKTTNQINTSVDKTDAGFDNNGDVKRTIGAALPATDPGSAGLYFNSTHFGYWDGVSWKNYFKSDGDAIIGDSGTGNYVFWDQSAGTMTVRGSLNADDITAGTITGRTLQTGSNIGPGANEGFEVNAGDGQAHFYGDRGDGTVEEITTIGVLSSGTAGYGQTIIGVGSVDTNYDGISITVGTGRAIDAFSVTGPAGNFQSNGPRVLDVELGTGAGSGVTGILCEGGEDAVSMWLTNDVGTGVNSPPFTPSSPVTGFWVGDNGSLHWYDGTSWTQIAP